MKRFYILIVTAILAAVGTLVACHENVIDESDSFNPGNQYYSVTNDIYVFKEDITAYIKDDVVDVTTIEFDANIPKDALPKVGTSIFIPVSEKTPYGVLAKVKSIDTAENVSVKIEPLSLDEAFEDLSIDETTPMKFEFDGVYDIDGNPIEFEIVDTSNVSKSKAALMPMSTRGIKSFEYDFDWKKERLKFPIKLYKTKSRKDKIEISGTLIVGFRDFDFDIDVPNFKFKYLKLSATPSISIELSSKVSTERELEISECMGRIPFRITIPTPVPIIIPVTTYIYGTFGMKGEMSATLGLQYEYNCKCLATYKNEQWSSDCKHGGLDNKSPWTVGEFDVKGEIYSGNKIGLIAGLYSATTGIGFNAMPKYSLSADAKLTSEDLLKTNPKVEMALKVGSEVYCAAEIFGKKLGKYALTFPDYILFSETAYLLPNIEDFTAIGSSASADISWWHDSFYFLAGLGLKTGTTVFESDGTTEVNSYRPSPSSTTFEKYSYNVNATGLKAGKTYYAAPFVYWGDYMWHGNMEEFTTEAGYRIMWRCEGREDIWDIDINISSTTTELNIPFEAATYNNGQTKRLLVATYNPSTGILTGTIETDFYDNPDDRRIDGFTADLTKEDTGYITNSKVLDNGACYTQIRFVKLSKQSKTKINSLPLGEDECGLGERIINE